VRGDGVLTGKARKRKDKKMSVVCMKLCERRIGAIIFGPLHEGEFGGLVL